MKAINQVCKVVISICLITTVLAGFKVMSEGSGLIPFLPISNENANDDNERNPIPNPASDDIPTPTIL